MGKSLPDVEHRPCQPSRPIQISRLQFNRGEAAGNIPATGQNHPARVDQQPVRSNLRVARKRENDARLPAEQVRADFAAVYSATQPRPGTGNCQPAAAASIVEIQSTRGAKAAARRLSDLGDRSKQGGRARPFFRSFEENSRSYLTKRIGKIGRSPTGAVDQSQVRQPPGSA